MPKQINVTLYSFSELTDKAKEKVRNEYREHDTFIDEFVMNDSKEVLTMLGFTNTVISYNGFSSQGDGASFTGNWSAELCKPDILKEYAPKDTALHSIADSFKGTIAEHPALIATIYRVTHHYSHEHTVSCDLDYDVNYALGSKILTDSRDLMRWIYKQLEKEYEYQASNEAIDEILNDSENWYTIDGKLYR